MNVLRVYICGAHSTGKTTLLQDLKPHLKNIKVEEEVARTIIQQHGWKREDFEPDKYPEVFEKLNTEILQAQIEIDNRNTELHQDFLCDRCIDPLIYGLIYLNSDAVDRMYEVPGLTQWIERLKCALVFVVEPHKLCIKDDAVRLVPTMEDLRDFTSSLKERLDNHDIPYNVIATLDRQERVQLVLQRIAGRRPSIVSN